MAHRRRRASEMVRLMKENILQKLKEIIENRIKNIEISIENARKSANEESKSSVGDKYETARAMGQLDQEMQSKQRQQALIEKTILDKINTTDICSKIMVGALTETSMGTFYVAIGAGMIEIDNKKIITISPQSPIGQVLMGKQRGENFSFRQKNEQILSVS
jgi:transcription elongation GreA/GreB family factor